MMPNNKIDFDYILSLLQPNLRTAENKISFHKHIFLGITIGFCLGFIIAALNSDYLLSFWGDDIVCPIKTGGALGCDAGFMYLTVITTSILGAISGFAIGLLRRFSEAIASSIDTSPKKN